jgi:hypothetical protein
MLTRPLVAALVLLVASAALAQPETRWKIDPAISFGHHKEQLRSADGSASTQISAHRFLALLTEATYALHPCVDAGLFLLAERGARATLGGGVVDYQLLWTGPIVRGNWRDLLFLEIGYVLYGIRKDQGLEQVASTSGDVSSAFRTDPSRAWLLMPGISFPLTDTVRATLRIEYRFHYYDRRGEDALAGGGAIGSQAVRPHLGVRFQL